MDTESERAEEPVDLTQNATVTSSDVRVISSVADDEHDITIIGVTEPTKAQIDKAVKLRLPRGFYLYEHRKSCPGCIGCEPESFDFNQIGKEGKLICYTESSQLRAATITRLSVKV